MQKLTADEVWESYLRKVKLEHGGVFSPSIGSYESG
jgi:hypothetical protein